MNVLIVHAHPEPNSFTKALADQAAATLAAQGHVITWSDLYAMRWNPVASPADFAERKDPDYCNYALEQRHASETQTLAPDIQAELDKLLAADLLLLSFPLYWCSVPAIMKGWFDRVLVSGKVYGGRRFYDQGGLAGKRAKVLMTCGARDYMVAAGGIHGDIHDILRPVLQGTLAYAGFSVLPPFVAHHVPYIAHEQRQQMLLDLATDLQQWQNQPPLAMPVLANYDREMRPLPK